MKILDMLCIQIFEFGLIFSFRYVITQAFNVQIYVSFFVQRVFFCGNWLLPRAYERTGFLYIHFEIKPMLNCVKPRYTV